MDFIWSINTTKMLPSPYTVKSALPICQGKPFEFSCPDRLWHNLIIQWIWQEEMLENLSETTEFSQFYWTQWWAGSNWAVCVGTLHKQMWIKQDFICLSKEGTNWTCCLQPGTPSITTASKQTTKHAFGCKQIKNRSLYPTHRHICLGKGNQHVITCLDKTTPNSRSLSSTSDLWMQIKM